MDEKYKITKQNYINMKKRLESNLKFYNFILTFGSLYLIILAVTDISFPEMLNSKLVTYFSLIQSIILFTISLVIRPEDTKNKIENLRNGILELNEISEKENAEEEYINLMKKMITREDIDYYNTSCELINSIKSENYIREMEIIKKNVIVRVQKKWYSFRYAIYIISLIVTAGVIYLLK